MNFYSVWFDPQPRSAKVAAARLSGDRDALTRAILDRALDVLGPAVNVGLALITLDDDHDLLLTIRQRFHRRGFKTSAFAVTLVAGGRESQHPLLLVAGVPAELPERLGSGRLRDGVGWWSERSGLEWIHVRNGFETPIAGARAVDAQSLLAVMRRITNIEATKLYADYPEESWSELSVLGTGTRPLIEGRRRLLETLRGIEKKKEVPRWFDRAGAIRHLWQPGTRITSMLGLRKLFAFYPPKLPCAVLPYDDRTANLCGGASRVEVLRCRVSRWNFEAFDEDVVLVCGLRRETILSSASELKMRFVILADEKTERIQVQKGKSTLLEPFEWERLDKIAAALFPNRDGNFNATVNFAFDPTTIATLRELEPWLNELDRVRSASFSSVCNALTTRDPKKIRIAMGDFMVREYATCGPSFGFASGSRVVTEESLVRRGIGPNQSVRLTFVTSRAVAAHFTDASTRTLTELVRLAGGTKAWVVRGPFIDHLDVAAARTVRTEPFSMARVHELIDTSLRELGVEEWTLRWWPGSWLAGMGVENRGMFRRFRWERAQDDEKS